MQGGPTGGRRLKSLVEEATRALQGDERLPEIMQVDAECGDASRGAHQENCVAAGAPPSAAFTPCHQAFGRIYLDLGRQPKATSNCMAQ